MSDSPSAPASRLDKFSVASLALGAAASATIWCCCIGYPVALVGIGLGVAALLRHQRDGYSATSKSLALAGIVTPVLAVLLQVVLLAVVQASKPATSVSDNTATPSSADETGDDAPVTDLRELVELVKPAEPAAPPEPERIKVMVSCMGSGDTVKVSCAVDDCPVEGAAVICRSSMVDFFASPDNTEINNWLREGVWTSKKGNWTLLDTEAHGVETKLTWDGVEHKGLAVTSHRAGVMLFGGAIADHTQRGPILALARFAEYQEGMVMDDVALEVGEVFRGEEADLQRAAWRLHRALDGANDIKDLRVGGTHDELLGDLWNATEGLDRNDRTALLGFHNTTAAKVLGAQATAKAKRIEDTRPTFEASAWDRARAIAVPWDEAFDSALSNHGWALPSAAACKGTPSSSDPAEIKAEQARRAEYVGELSRYARVVRAEVRAKADGQMKEVSSELFGTRSFALSGKVSMKSTPSCGPECCNVITGECTPRLFGCEARERLRTKCGDPSYDWQISGIPTKISMPSPVEAQKGEVLQSVEAEAVVVVTKAFHNCKDSAFLSSQWSGEVIAYRVKNTGDGSTVAEVVKRDVTVEEALAGPDEFHFKRARK